MSPAHADYELPRAEEQYYLITDNWQLAENAVSVVRGGRRWRWKIDRFWLADRVCSDSICTGSYEEVTRHHLKEIRLLPVGSSIQIELVAAKRGEPLFVAGVWKCDPAKAFQEASRYGSKLLGLSASQVKNLGSAMMYQDRIQQLSNRNWKVVESRD